MSASARIAFEILPEAMVVTVNAPKMDYMIVDSLQRRISAQATMAGKVDIILDLGQVEHISTMIISVLVKTLEHLADQGRKFILVGMNRHMRTTFQICRIDMLFQIHDDRRAAIRALAARECSAL